MFVLSFESSCDETACAVLKMDENTRQIQSNIIASSVDTQALYGGVVPEIASRAHIEAISGITYEALQKADLTIDDIDLIAVTNGPGLIGALLVAVNFAKSLAYAHGIPLVAVDHIKGHVAGNYLTYQALKPPFLALVVSGGHTSFFDVKSYTEYVEIASTRDDACGECFDKIGRVMGLPYPGGVAIDRLAYEGKPTFAFPSPSIAGDTLDFSFSGLKTHVVNVIHQYEQKGQPIPREDICASFVKVITASICEKVKNALIQTGYRKIVLAGGVSANSHIRAGIASVCKEVGAEFYAPELSLCGDNGAMIGAQGYYEYLSGKRENTSLNAYPS